jgi:wobble nucleotide-excising tRNase
MNSPEKLATQVTQDEGKHNTRALTVVSYDKVRGRNKAQQWTRSVCVRFFITTITQPDTISQDTILIERLLSGAYASTRVVVLIERLVSVAYASLCPVVL